MKVSINDYIHEETILRFMGGYEISRDEAEDIFHQMKKLLLLMNHYGKDEYIFTHEPLWIIDEMWHTFILFTQDYQNFCLTYLGRFIHHDIVKRKQKQKIILGLEQKDSETVTIVSNAVQRLYELIYEYLGKETLIKWIDGYAKKYTIAYMNKIRKPIV
jgi:hypothetical protein